MFNAMRSFVVALLLFSLVMTPPLAFAGDALVDIVTEPAGATIWVDGQEMGESPNLLELSPGDHKIKVGKKTYLDVVETVRVTQDEVKELLLPLQKDPAYLLRQERSALAASYLADYKAYTLGQEKILALQQNIKPLITQIDGKVIEAMVMAKTRRLPSENQYMVSKKSLNCNPGNCVIIPMWVVMSPLICLGAGPKKTLDMFPNDITKKRSVLDPTSYQTALKQTNEYNFLAREEAVKANEKIISENEILQKKLNKANQEIAAQNQKTDRQIATLEKQLQLEKLKSRMAISIQKIIDITHALGDKIKLPTRPTYGDYAKWFSSML